MIVVHGLKNCDGCRAAMKRLGAAGIDARLNDIGTDGVARETLAHWLAALGAAVLVNRKSATWRGLDDVSRALAEDDPLALLAANPKLIKRPVIETPDGAVHAGLGDDLLSRLSSP